MIDRNVNTECSKGRSSEKLPVMSSERRERNGDAAAAAPLRLDRNNTLGKRYPGSIRPRKENMVRRKEQVDGSKGWKQGKYGIHGKQRTP